jgi:hypothetical protein
LTREGQHTGGNKKSSSPNYQENGLSSAVHTEKNSGKRSEAIVRIGVCSFLPLIFLQQPIYTVVFLNMVFATSDGG